MMEPNVAPNVRWGEWISEGWQMFAVRWEVWVLQTLIVFLTTGIPISAIYIWAIIIEGQIDQSQDMPLTFLAFLLVAMPLIILPAIYFWGGLWRTATKQLRGEKVSGRDLFYGGNHFLSL